MLCVINRYLNVIVRSFPCNENKCYLRDEDNCCGSWTWVHFRCSSGTILFFSYAALAPNFEFEWDCEKVRRMVYFSQHPSHLADPSSRYRKKQQLLFRLQPVQPESDQPGLLAHPNRPYKFAMFRRGGLHCSTRTKWVICGSWLHIGPMLWNWPLAAQQTGRSGPGQNGLWVHGDRLGRDFGTGPAQQTQPRWRCRAGVLLLSRPVLLPHL